jgi:hypothetical protein
MPLPSFTPPAKEQRDEASLKTLTPPSLRASHTHEDGHERPIYFRSIPFRICCVFLIRPCPHPHSLDDGDDVPRLRAVPWESDLAHTATRLS